MEDRDLVNRILQGETALFAAVIRQTQGPVAQIVFKLIKNPEDRRDLAQDIYLKAFKNVSNFQFQSKLRKHIHSCPFCRQKVEMYQLLFSEAVKPPVPMFDFGLTESIMQQLPQSETAAPETSYWAYWIGAGALLSVGMMLSIFMVYLRPLFRELTPITLGVSVTALLALFAVPGYDMFLKYRKQLKILQSELQQFGSVSA